jgi:outer membrane murein-binding lipoprotein Lpp
MSNPAPAFAIVQLHPHEPAPDNMIMWGSLDAVMERIIDSNARNAAVDILRDARIAADQLEQTRTQETQILARGLQTLNASIDQLTRRMDAIEEQREVQVRYDAAREQQQIQDYLDALPSPDDDPDQHFNTGDLHSLPPAEHGQSATDQGALPEELLKNVPPETGNYPEPDPSELAHPATPKYRAPAAISLASE